MLPGQDILGLDWCAGPAGPVTGLGTVIGPFIVQYPNAQFATAPMNPTGSDIFTFPNTGLRQYAIASVAGHIIGISGFGRTGPNDSESRITLNAAVNDVFAATSPNVLQFEIGSMGPVGTPPGNYQPITPYAFNAGDRISMQFGNSNAGASLVIQAFLTITVGS
jgi:hypothetical protein